MSAEENKAVIRRLAEAVNKGTLDAVDNILASDYVRHDPSALLGDVGREEYKHIGCTTPEGRISAPQD